MRGWISSETDREGDNYFATREERKTSGSCASGGFQWFPVSRCKYHCDRLQRSLLILRKICKYAKIEEDEKDRKWKEATWRRKKGRKENSSLRAKMRSIISPSNNDPIFEIWHPRQSVPDNSCEKVTSAIRLREDNTESCKNRGFQQRAKNYLRFKSIPAFI